MTARHWARCIEAVKRHMALEVTHEWEAVFATFERPYYELNGSDTAFNGQEAVRSWFASSRAPLPHEDNENTAIVHTDEKARVGLALTGTHPGSLRLGHKVMAQA
jgi:uncharacterized OB-fold protein